MGPDPIAPTGNWGIWVGSLPIIIILLPGWLRQPLSLSLTHLTVLSHGLKEGGKREENLLHLLNKYVWAHLQIIVHKDCWCTESHPDGICARSLREKKRVGTKLDVLQFTKIQCEMCKWGKKDAQPSSPITLFKICSCYLIIIGRIKNESHHILENQHFQQCKENRSFVLWIPSPYLCGYLLCFLRGCLVSLQIISLKWRVSRREGSL